MKTVTLTTQISKADFVKVSLSLYYRNAAFLVITAAMLSLLLANVYLKVYKGSKGFDSFAPILILLVLPGSVVLSASQRYRSNPQNQKPVSCTFDEESFQVKADKSESKCELSTLYKVVKVNRWLFIYRTKKLANMVPLSDISGDQLEQLKELLDGEGVKNNL